MTSRHGGRGAEATSTAAAMDWVPALSRVYSTKGVAAALALAILAFYYCLVFRSLEEEIRSESADVDASLRIPYAYASAFGNASADGGATAPEPWAIPPPVPANGYVLPVPEVAPIGNGSADQPVDEAVADRPVVQHDDASRQDAFPVLKTSSPQVAGVMFPRWVLKLPKCPDLPEGADPGNQSWIFRHYPRPTTFEREECECTPVHNFAVISLPRSGSRWFISMINDHPNAIVHKEFAAHMNNVVEMMRTIKYVYNLDYFKLYSEKHIPYEKHHLDERKNSTCVSAIGFKWMLRKQFLWSYRKYIKKYLIDNHISIIFLLRRNLLERLVALRALEITPGNAVVDVYHAKTKKEVEMLKRFKPGMNVLKLLENLKEDQTLLKEALEYFQTVRHMTIYYEDLRKNTDGILKNVFHFLGLPPMHVNTSLVLKVHDNPLSSRIRNYDAVKRALEKTEFAHFLDV